MSSRAAVPILLACALGACAPGSEPSSVAGLATGPHSTAGSASTKLGGASQSVPRGGNYYVVLDGPPAVAELPAGLPLDDPTAVARVRARLAAIAAEHDTIRPEIEARGAVVVAELSRLGNLLQVMVPDGALDDIARLPGVRRIERVPAVRPSLASAVPLIGAPALWSATPGLQGKGMRIGIIDSGVDYLHADFGGGGDPAEYASNDPTVIEPGSFPTARVIGGWDFAGNAYNAEDPSSEPAPDPDPLDCKSGHGTHVTGIAAGGGVLLDGTSFTGPYEQSLDPGAFSVAPGVAPRAELYVMKIFGCGGSTMLLASALERAADPNEDGIFDDRLDVVNASLGSSYGLWSPVNAMLVSNLMAVGGLLVVAAGNDGGTFFITGTPAVYPPTLSVAASADEDLLALHVDAPSAITGDYPAAEGYFTTPLRQVGPISAELAYVEPHDACDPLQNAAEISGRIALIDRGTCPFVDKLQRAEAAGAVAAVVVDYQLDTLPWPMGGGNPGDSPLVGVMIRRGDGELLEGWLDAPVTITLDPSRRFTGLGAETLTSFSSRGPAGAGGALKPEVAAPGWSVDSANAGSGVGGYRSQGTSMACPMVTGAAALLRQARPALGPVQIKALLMNTAVPVVDERGRRYPVSMQGSGRIDVSAAASRQVLARLDEDGGAAGIAFGAMVADAPVTEERRVTVQNFGQAAVSYQLSLEQDYPLPGVTLTVEPAALTVAGGQSETVVVRLTLDPDALGAPGPDPLTPPSQRDLPRHFLSEAAGRLRLLDQAGEQSLVLPFHAVVRAAATRAATVVQGCAGTQPPETLTIEIGGHAAHPEPVVSAFELGALDDENPESATSPAVAELDLRAVGLATNGAVAASFDDLTLHFGLAVAGPWTTPAAGPYSLVGVLVDSDGDHAADHTIVAEPFTSQGPYADVLVASTYDLATGQRVGSRHFINMAPRSQIDTQPFESDVLVLSAFARDVGLTEQSTTLRYSAYSQTIDSSVPSDSTDWAEVQLDALRLDAAADAPEPGVPLYSGEQPVRLRLGPGALEEPAAELLLLHHTNVAGQRFEVVDLGAFEREQVSLTEHFATPFEARARVAGQVVVQNDGAAPLREAQLELSLTGAELELAASAVGDCQAGASAVNSPVQRRCALGTIAPGATAAVTLVLRVGADPDAVGLVEQVDSAAGCSTERQAELSAPELAAPSSLQSSGGCGCWLLGAAARGPSLPPWCPPSGAAWLGALLALAAWRRRQHHCAP